MQEMRTRTSVRRRTGEACSTAVALGVKPKNLKASGPENADPILLVCSGWVCRSREGYLGIDVGQDRKEGFEDDALADVRKWISSN